MECNDKCVSMSAWSSWSLWTKNNTIVCICISKLSCCFI